MKLKVEYFYFLKDLKMIDDDKFKRIKEIMKFYGFPLDLKQSIETLTDLSPLAKVIKNGFLINMKIIFNHSNNF
jgi:hypothetical protein